MQKQRGNGKGLTDTFRYVDDFKTELVTDASGKTRKKTTYIGIWYVLRETGSQTVGMLIGAAALAVCTAVLGGFVLLTNHAGSGSYWVLIPHGAALFPALYLLMGAASLPYRQKPMRRDQYMHGFVRMQRSSVAVLAITAVGMIASVVVRAIAGDWMFLSGDIRYYAEGAAMLLACGAILFLLGRIDLAEYPNSYWKEEPRNR